MTKKIKLTRKLLNKYEWASNQTLDKLEDYKNYEILTKDYSKGEYELGLIWCWDEDKSKGTLFRFEFTSN